MKKISGPRIRVLSELPTNIDTASRNPHWVPNSHLFKSFPQFCRPFPSMFPNSWLLSSLPFPTPLTLAQKKNSSYLLTRSSIPFQQTCWNSLRCSFFILLYEFIALALSSCLLLSFSSLCCPFSWKIDENCMSFWWLEVNPFKAKPFFMAEKHFVAFLHWRVLFCWYMLIYVATHSPPIRLVKKCEDAMQLLV